jgi:transcriptional regulator with XRE-family HTH domain
VAGNPTLHAAGWFATSRTQGMTVKDIGAQLGISHQAVCQLLRGCDGTVPSFRLRCRTCRKAITSGHGSLRRNGSVLCLRCLTRQADSLFSECLRAHRLAAGLTRAGLAAKAGLSPAVIGNYERNITMPTYRSLVKLARALPLKMPLSSVVRLGA